MQFVKVTHESNMPLHEHTCISPHYVNLGLIKLPDIVKLSTCQLLYDPHIIEENPSNFTLSFVSEQHNYATRSTSLQHLNPSSCRINVLGNSAQQLLDVIIGMIFLYPFVKFQLKNYLKEHSFRIILLSIKICLTHGVILSYCIFFVSRFLSYCKFFSFILRICD